LLVRGSTVILDASWSAEARRLEAGRLAGDTSSVLESFLCEVGPEVAAARAAARTRDGTDASDASAAIASELRDSFAPWPQAQALDTTTVSESLVTDVLARLHSNR